MRATVATVNVLTNAANWLRAQATPARVRSVASDVAFLGFAGMSGVGVWHFSPAVALILGGLVGMAYVVLAGGKKGGGDQ